MMMETTMSRSSRLIFSGGLALGIGTLAQTVYAGKTADQTTTTTNTTTASILGSDGYFQND